MAKSPGMANHDGHMSTIQIGSPGGGMSASENRMVNHKGRTIGSKSGPKATNDGKDLGPNAKNKISGPAGLLTKEQSPTSWPQSRNRGKHYK
jgi:hypothetical protein